LKENNATTLNFLGEKKKKKKFFFPQGETLEEVPPGPAMGEVKQRFKEKTGRRAEHTHRVFSTTKGRMNDDERKTFLTPVEEKKNGNLQKRKIWVRRNQGGTLIPRSKKKEKRVREKKK